MYPLCYEAPRNCTRWMRKKKFCHFFLFIPRVVVVKKKEKKLLKSKASPHLRRSSRLSSFRFSCCPSTKAYHFSVIFLFYQQQCLHVIFLPHSGFLSLCLMPFWAQISQFILGDEQKNFNIFFAHKNEKKFFLPINGKEAKNCTQQKNLLTASHIISLLC